MNVEEIIEFVSQNNPDTILFTCPDFNDAIIGWIENNAGLPVICYDYWKMVESLTKEFEEEENNPYKEAAIKEDTYDPAIDAMEWIDYNTLRTLPYIDEIGRPVILYN